MPTATPFIDEAVALIAQAKDLEKKSRGGGGGGQQQPPRSPSSSSSSWAALEEAANKYHEACYLLKHRVKSGGLGKDEKRLLVGKINEYEPHADGLLEEAKGLKKIADDDRRRRGTGDNNENGSGRRGAENFERNNVDGPVAGETHKRGSSSNSSWEKEHKSQLHHTTTANDINNGESTAENGTSSNSESRKMEAFEAAERAGQCLAVAKDRDELGETSEAVNGYCQAAKSYLHAVDLLSPANKETAAQHEDLISTLKQKVGGILDRVKELKERPTAPPPSAPPIPTTTATITTTDPAPSAPPAAEATSPSRSVGTRPSPPPQQQQQQLTRKRNDRLTPYEVQVLSWSSRIASGLFLPWDDEEARTYDYSPPRPYVDPDGPLELSEKQRASFDRWARPSEIRAMRRASGKTPLCEEIVMVRHVTPYSIKQHCVSDCSFVAGLCVAAAYERRFDRKLVSSIVYPRDPRTGMPVYNPKGVYMVKLWLNGVARRVLIDDALPVDERGNLLCSHTTSTGKQDGRVLELWVPILEKAYMKLCGGYDFPGSNSGVDLFALTGWIPERLFFPEDPDDVKDFEIPTERAWERLRSAGSYGDCLVTVSTSKDLTEERAERVGLFTGHAYAVLGVVQTSNGTRMLQLKNPWASKGWKGRFSSRDKDGWRDPKFCKEVGYDPSAAVRFDDGVFWMCWDDILLYFRNIHMSWSTDPALFRCRTSVHGYWNKESGPVDDSYNAGDNPQYTVTLSEKAIANRAKLWILLSRHVTKQEQEGGEVTDFLTQHIHRIKNPQERVWYPNSTCVLTGAYTNNQHVLVKYDAKGPEDNFLSIVLSQYKKSNDLGYTLSCYCTEEFELGQPEPPLPKSQQLVGSWKLRDSVMDKSYSLAIGTAGGPPGKGSFGSNPQWSVGVPAGGTRIQVKCMAPKELPINIILARCERGSARREGDQSDGKGRRIHHLYEDPIIDTGAYRRGFSVSEAVFIPAGSYTLVASTFEVGQVGRFILNVFTSKGVHISEVGQ